jgi:hypothetical protein
MSSKPLYYRVMFASLCFQNVNMRRCMSFSSAAIQEESGQRLEALDVWFICLECLRYRKWKRCYQAGTWICRRAIYNEAYYKLTMTNLWYELLKLKKRRVRSEQRARPCLERRSSSM